MFLFNIFSILYNHKDAIYHKILPQDKIIKQGKLSFMHSDYYSYAPRSFENTWIKNEEWLGDYNLRNDDLYMLPIPRLEIIKRLPIYALPAEWNSAGELKYYMNKITFKHALREKLFEELIDENLWIIKQFLVFSLNSIIRDSLCTHTRPPFCALVVHPLLWAWSLK